MHRGLTAEGGAHEFGLPTFPSRRFVDASDGAAGLALLHDGLLEYEVVDDGHALALTLLRAVGYLSRTEPQLRPNPAGPADALAGPQLQARSAPSMRCCRIAATGARPIATARPTPSPFRSSGRVTTRGEPSRPSVGNMLSVDGAEVSAVLRVPGGLVLRVFRTAADEGPVTIEHDGAPARGFVVDLRGRPVAPFEHELALNPWQIATVQLS